MTVQSEVGGGIRWGKVLSIGTASAVRLESGGVYKETGNGSSYNSYVLNLVRKWAKISLKNVGS